MYGHGIATLALCECYGIMTLAPTKGERHIAPAETGTPNESTSISQTREVNAMEHPVSIDTLGFAAKAMVEFMVNTQATDEGHFLFCLNFDAIPENLFLKLCDEVPSMSAPKHPIAGNSSFPFPKSQCLNRATQKFGCRTDGNEL